MPRAVFDTSVLFAATYQRDAAHDDAVPLLRGVDAGELPEAVILDYVLAETLNGLLTHAGHEAAVDLLDRLEKNTRFHIDSLTASSFATAKDQFRRYPSLSFVDACIVTYMQAKGMEYLYAFDEDFDGVAGVSRLDTLTNPYNPR